VLISFIISAISLVFIFKEINTQTAAKIFDMLNSHNKFVSIFILSQGSGIVKVVLLISKFILLATRVD